MSSRALSVRLVALVAIAVVAVGIVFLVLRRGSESGLGYEGEIPVVDKDEIPVFTAEVSTVSLPIKADYAALTSEIRDAARKRMTIPGPVSKGPENVWQEKPFKVVFYYTADLLSLDVSLGDGSPFAAKAAEMRRALKQMKDAVSKMALALIERQLEQQIARIEALADRPVLNVTGEIRLHGTFQQKQYFWWPINDWKKLWDLADYDAKFRFTKLYSVGLDESAKLIFEDSGQADMIPLGHAKLTVAKIPFEDWFGGLKKAIMPELGKKVDEALKEHVEIDRLTPLYEKGWKALHNPIKLADEVWLVFHPEGFEVAQLHGSSTMLETTVTVRGRPKVILGDKPQVPQVPPRPPVRLGEVEGGLHVVVDAIAPLDEAERLLNKELGQLEEFIYNQAKVKVKVPKARIYSCENCLRLELLLTKPFRGSVFLEGAPRYDVEMSELYVEGLDFTVDTKNVLAKPASWLLESPPLVDYLQKKVRLPVGGELATVSEAISKYDGEEIADGMVLQLGDTSFKVLCVYNTREAMHLIVQADGSAEVTMN